MRTKSVQDTTTGDAHGLLPKRWSYSAINGGRGAAALGKRETNLREYRGLVYLIDCERDPDLASF